MSAIEDTQSSEILCFCFLSILDPLDPAPDIILIGTSMKMGGTGLSHDANNEMEISSHKEFFDKKSFNCATRDRKSSGLLISDLTCSLSCTFVRRVVMMFDMEVVLVLMSVLVLLFVL